ncbi:MAG TPA: zinc dependent phospholipase C family protein, partial [Gemmatimonadales bacterium]|nr:zinc dependent phospholipase C family protein [Gemmatimonadales bacterium]
MRWFWLFTAAVLVIALFPTDAHAWTPGTHIYLAESILSRIDLLPGLVGDLLRAFPYDYLYGSIAADTSFAKKYAPVGRHPHHWHVAQEIHDTAQS